MLSTEELLQKAVLSVGDGVGSGDFGGTGQAPLSVEQVTQFIELMSAQQVMLSDVRTVTSSAAKWQESIINFATRITRPGVEATRLDTTKRAKPSTGSVEISTVLLRAEVPVSDEVFEDNVAGQNLTQSLERTITDRFGFDIEDLFVNGDTGFSAGSSDDQAYYQQLNGWLHQAKVATGNNAFDATTFGQDYQEIFRKATQSMPRRFLRNLTTDGRFYISTRVEQKYRDILSSRGTPLGDLMLTGKNELRYQGVLILGVPSFDAGVDIVGATKGNVLLTNHNNLYAGFHRTMKFETWRDPREGATSFIVTARVDAKIAVPSATVLAYNVDETV